ncbi:mannose-ethanolamine phosphotransferase gpi13 [Mortierella alpina]|nr:mannose-ethanolamine phosphotransferase gpi13 [Mortierella alpina]
MAARTPLQAQHQQGSPQATQMHSSATAPRDTASLRPRTSTAAAAAARPTHPSHPSHPNAASRSKEPQPKERAPSTRLAKLLLWVFLVHVGAIYLFTRGFLLSRSVLAAKSECNNTNIDESFFSWQGHGKQAQDNCWYPQQYKKAVVVVIDALRFDFVVPHNNLPDNEKEPHYLNKLPVIHNLLEDQPENTLVYQFVADPPTTTLQRLKALTTGTLPTIIEAGFNFASSALKEDNWLSQFEASRGRDRILFMGDDTWTGLFPNILTANNSHAFPSFDTHDLDTLDNGVIKELGPALKDQSKWDLLIAHFLGVDHCGHTYGPNDPHMAQKLELMNEQLEKVIASVSDDTLVVIMGDHGMNGHGDHGGDSDDEIEAGLIIYSKRKLNNAGIVDRFSLGDMLQYTKPVGGNIYRTVAQIDLVPTLSLLLGLPIPFNNLGSVIPELFLSAKKPDDAVRDLLRAMRLNAAQVATYFESYKDLDPSSDIALAMQVEFGELFKRAERFMAEIGQDRRLQSVDNLVEAVRLYSGYLRTSLTSCKRIWAHFDVPLMTAGGGVLIASCLCLLLYITIFRSVGMPPHLERFLAGGTLLGIILARHLKPVLLKLQTIQDSSIGLVDIMVFCMSAFSIAGFLLCMVLQSKTLLQASGGWNLQRSIRWPPLSGFLACLFVFVNCLIFASNSYIVHESTFVIGFLQTFGVIGLLFSLRVPNKVERNKAVVLILSFMVMTRVISSSTVCREEQGDLCSPTFYASSQQSVPSQWSMVCLVASGAITPYLIRRLLSRTKSMNGIALIWIDYGLRIGIILGTLYAVLDFEGSKADVLRNQEAGNTFGPLKAGLQQTGHYLWIKTTLVRVAFGFALVVGPAAWWSNPLCMDIQTVDVPTDANGGNGNASSGTTKGAKTTTTPATERKIYILGYANAFGASYYVALSMLFLFAILTQKPLGALVLTVGLAQISCLVELVDIWRDAQFEIWQQGVIERIQAETAAMADGVDQEDVEGTIKETSGPSPADAESSAAAALAKHPRPPTLDLLLPTVVLSLLGNLLFFATGHQATLSSVQWSAAFIGVPTLNYFFSPILVIINTLGPFILCAAALPLVVLWKLPPKADKLGKIVLFPELTRLCLMMMMHQSLVLAANMFFTGGMFRRHLMVWKVFAPRFMLQASTLLIMDLVLVSVAVLGILARVSEKNPLRDHQCDHTSNPD